MSTKRFPEGFYWGAATASYQVEGGIENNDWAEAARAGRVPPCGIACDHYHRYIQDFDIAKSLGHSAHRFSIEWSRIEPEEGKFDRAAIAHYRQVLLALRDRRIVPFITIWHFTLPLWFSQSGGFERADSPEVFARYAAYVVKELGDLCTHFSTMNEPNVFGSNGWLRGSWPPFKRFALTDFVSITNSGRTYEARAERGFGAVFTYLKVMKHLAKAHNAAYTAIKRFSPTTEVSVVKHVIPIPTVTMWHVIYCLFNVRVAARNIVTAVQKNVSILPHYLKKSKKNCAKARTSVDWYSIKVASSKPHRFTPISKRVNIFFKNEVTFSFLFSSL